MVATPRIAVLGAGSWGSALASTLVRSGHDVILWARRAEQVESLRAGMNPANSEGPALPDALGLTANFNLALEGADVLVLATPAVTTQELCERLAEGGARGKPCVLLAKGLERSTGRRLSEVASSVLGADTPVMVLLGPSHAEEVVVGQPTALVLAGATEGVRTGLQTAFSGPSLRIYTNQDLIGVETAAALKNVLAIAAGICDGLGLGDNAKGALLARGVTEMARLGVHLGARRETFFGLSGIGDVITTCLSRHSRNRALGERVGRGESLDDAVAAIGQVVEGVETTRTVVEMAAREGETMPIATEVAAVLFENKSPSEAMNSLMLRSLKPE